MALPNKKTTPASKISITKAYLAKNKWLLAGLVIGFINPLAAVIYSIVLTTEVNLKRTGQIVIVVTIIWWAAILVLTRLFIAK